MFKEIIIISSLFLIGCGGGSFSDGLPTQPTNTTTQINIATPSIPIQIEQNSTTPDIENNITTDTTPPLNSNSTVVDNSPIDTIVDTNSSIQNEDNITIEDNNETDSTDNNITNENNTTQEEEPPLIVENNDTRPNIILVHGLNSGASAWNIIEVELSNYMRVDDNLSVEVAVDINIFDNAKCFDGAVDDEIFCNNLSNIKSQNKYRSIANDKVFGLKKGDFDVTQVEYHINNNIPTQSILEKQKVFSINFSNSNQLSFDAQGYELKKMIDDISTHTGIDNFILIGHSMGGLAIRAYIQNEEHKLIEKVITLNTPHLGGNGGTYNEVTQNAGVNLANDSKSYQILNSNTTDKYTNIKLYYLGYSNDISGEGDDLYFSSGDGVVDIGSQMGLNTPAPHRVIFSPNAQTLDTFQYISSTATKEWDDESIEINDLGEFAHSEVLKDIDYIYVILDIIKN